MPRKLFAAALGAAFCALAFINPVKASVLYQLTFKSGSTVVGTGTVTLNYSALTQAYNQNTSLAGILTSITTTDLHGHGAFSITPANLLSGSQFQTGPVGEIYTFTAIQAGSAASTVLFLDLYSHDWQLQKGNAYGGWVDGGELIVSGPILAQAAPVETPLPAALALFLSGLGALGLLTRRWKSQPRFATA